MTLRQPHEADPSVRGRPWKPTVHRTTPTGRTWSAICPWTLWGSITG